MRSSSEVSWLLDGIEMFATVTRPDGDGPFPAVVFVAVLYLVVVALTGDPPGGPERRRDSGRDT